MEQVFHLHEHRIEIQYHWCQHLLAAEGKELACQCRSALSGLVNLGNLLVRPIVMPEAAEDELTIANDRSQQIVEVVGNTAGQSPYCLQLLGLQKLLLEAFGPGNVQMRAGGAQRFAVGIAGDDFAAGQNPLPCTRFCPHAELGFVKRCLTVKVGREHRPYAWEVFGVHELG